MDTCDVIVTSPEIDVEGVEDTKEREPPGDTVNDNKLASGAELVDDGPKKQEMDDGPRRNEGVSCLWKNRRTR